jgi:hypothetical protein
MPIITSNPVSPPQDLNIGSSTDHLSASYWAQELHVDYFGDEGLLQVPVGAPFPAGNAQVPCKVVRTHAPVQVKVVTYAYARIMLPPVIPAPETTDPNLRLSSHERLFSAGQEVSPGIMLYIRVGEYRYAVIKPLTTAERMPIADNPAYTPQAADDAVDAQEYSDTILAT